jgi:hypothetical protein
LLHFRKVVLWIAVELQSANFDQRIVAVGPYFGQVKRVPLEGFSLLFGHDLHFDRPARILTPRDRFKQIALMGFTVNPNRVGRLFTREVFHTLADLKVKLAPESLAFSIHKGERMTPVAVHVTVASRQSAIAKQNRNLVQRLRIERPEIPLHIGIPQVSLGVTLLGVDEVGELVRIANKKDRGVVTN